VSDRSPSPRRDPHKVCFITFGCQMNKLDSELVAAEFVRRGATLTSDTDQAGVIIINTCSVRKHAEDRALSNLGRFKHAKKHCPQLILVLMGCMAQKEGPKLLRDHPHLDVVCGTRQFLRLPELVERARTEGERIVLTDDGTVAFDRLASVRPERHRAFLSVMRGCNGFCTYCIVPYVRGRETCRPPEHIEEEIHCLVDDGCVEVTLLGQNVDAYRHNDTDLAALLERLDRVPGLKRLRFVTSHPRDISDRLLHAVADLPTVCEHLHVPAQSGSDPILKAMHRGYTARRYRQVVDSARTIVPDVELAGDFIVGFPGETETDFQATLDLLQYCQYNQAFIFKYSPREGTRAARMIDDVPQDIKARRNQALLAAQKESAHTHNQSKLGRTLEVMLQGPSKRDPARLHGRTRGNDIVVFTPPPAWTGEPGDLVQVRIDHCTPLTLFGTLTPTSRPLKETAG